MKKYQVELEVDAIFKRLRGKANTIFIYRVGPSIYVLVFGAIPLYFYWQVHQKYFPFQTYILLAHLAYANCAMFLVYLFAIKKKSASFLSISLEFVTLIHIFLGSVLCGYAAGYNEAYVFVVVTLFIVSNSFMVYTAFAAHGPLIDHRLSPLFSRKDAETFICNPDYEDDDFSAREKCNEIIRKTKFGWVTTLFSWSIWIVFPLFMYAFSDTFIEDNAVSSGVVGIMSIGFLMLYLATRKAYLYQLILYRAVRRREMGICSFDYQAREHGTKP